MTVTMKIVNSVRARSLQRRLFRAQLEENESEHLDLILHTDIRWLSRGKFLQRFRDLLPEICDFLSSRGDDYKQLHDPEWLMNLAFLADVTNLLNDLNLKLQGKDKNITEMISTISAFKKKLNLVISQLERQELWNFKNMSAELERQEKQLCSFSYSTCIDQLKNVSSDFDARFEDFSAIEPVASFMAYPFGTHIDVEVVTSAVSAAFHLDRAATEDEVVALQTDIRLKSVASESGFWHLLSEEKYPNLRNCALRITACFGSTYLCESTFSHMKHIKSKNRSTVTDDHLDNCLRLALSSYIPEYQKLSEALQMKAPQH